MQLRHVNRPGEAVDFRASRHIHGDRHDRTGHDAACPPGPRGADAARTLARLVTGRPLEACTSLFARYGDTVYVPVPPWEGLYIFSRPEQAEHVLATNQDNYVKPFTYRPLRMMLGDGLLTAEDPLWRRHRRIIQPVFATRNVASFAPDMDAGAQRAVAGWRGSQAVDVAAEMSALTLDVVGQVLFGADLLSEAPPLRRALAAGQWLALLGAFLPIPRGANLDPDGPTRGAATRRRGRPATGGTADRAPSSTAHRWRARRQGDRW
jgi:cytochrome P450